MKWRVTYLGQTPDGDEEFTHDHDSIWKALSSIRRILKGVADTFIGTHIKQITISPVGSEAKPNE